MKKINKVTELNHDLEKVIVDGVEYFFISYYLDVVCLIPIEVGEVLYIVCNNDIPEREMYVL